MKQTDKQAGKRLRRGAVLVLAALLAFGPVGAAAPLAAGPADALRLAEDAPLETVAPALNKQTVTVKVDGTVQLKEKTGAKITWTSNRPHIAKVSRRGLVTGVARGKAVVTALTESGRRLRCTVYVGTLVKSVSLNAKKAKVQVGDRVRLKATVLPEDAVNQTVTFTSSDPAVATVGEKGVVVARSVGKAVITAQTQDRNRKATFTIRVYPKPQSIALNVTALELGQGKRKRLKAAVEPSNALVAGLTWKSNRPRVATVDDKGQVRAVGLGTATITVTDDRGVVKARCKVTVGMASRVFQGRIKVTSGYQLPTRPDHNGIDIVGLDSDKVYATVGGRVRYARIVSPSAGGRTWEWGYFVWIEGEDGLHHIYAHMKSQPKVREGSTIKAGTQLGVMGNTGYSFGVHTHYEIRTASGQTVNPAPYTGVENKLGIY